MINTSTHKPILFVIISIFILILLPYRVNLIDFKLSTSADTPMEKRLGTTGYAIGHIKDIFDSWYEFDLYPVKKNIGDKISKESTENQNTKAKNTKIVMRDGSTIFQGEFYRLHYAVPHYLFFDNVSPKTTNIILSISSIFLLLSYGFLRNKIIFSSIMIFSLILSDYYIYENFINENIFGVGISILIIFFSIFQLFSKNIRKYYVLWFICFGIIIGFFANVRTELIFLLLSITIFSFFHLRFKIFIISIIILLITFLSAQEILNKNFVNKINMTNSMISQHNGITYDGPIGGGHTFWHPFWMGLGDNIIGQNLGFNWGDKTAYDYVATINPNLFSLNEIDSHRLIYSYDDYGIYQKKPELIPEYQNTLKNDIFKKMNENKLDFLMIYKNKISNILLITQGIDLGLPFPPSFERDYYDDVKIEGKNILSIGIILTIVSLIISIKSRVKIYSKQYQENWSFIISSLPIALPALIVSDMGATYISIFHYLIFGLAAQYLWNFFFLKNK
jgi:hypothetical protein